jgi:hypothetical protein
MMAINKSQAYSGAQFGKELVTGSEVIIPIVSSSERIRTDTATRYESCFFALPCKSTIVLHWQCS